MAGPERVACDAMLAGLPVGGGGGDGAAGAGSSEAVGVGGGAGAVGVGGSSGRTVGPEVSRKVYRLLFAGAPTTFPPGLSRA